jgi:glucosamine--fructose-6-phosphate aminotransferase (isomerizing)
MCGIVGIIGEGNVVPRLLESLERLAYRGYDSAGVATLSGGAILRRRAEGKLARLAALLAADPISGPIGIGHTRWATHGAPSERNAHPHGTERVVLVHNGIIENYAALRAELEAEGHRFETDTDSEVAARLVDHHLARGLDPVAAAAAAFRRLEGAYALALLFASEPNLLIAAQRGAPLAVGFGEDGVYLASDALALAPFTRRVAYLQDGDWAVLRRGGVRFFDAEGTEVVREARLTALSGAAIGKGGFRHFMEKELHEHPAVIGETLHRMIAPAERRVVLPPLPFDLGAVSHVALSACGSAFYAGLVGRNWIETLARLPVEADIASEFRYRAPPLPEGGLGLVISQSGETADTLAALRYMKAAARPVLAIVNVPESSMARAADAVLETVAGPEIGVASTKAFTAQLTVLACLALALGRARRTLDPERETALTAALLELPSRAAEALEMGAVIRELAEFVAEARDVLYLGRGLCYPIALEGALKLKEISYIHAEGLAAGEMKHGPIALIDKNVPVIALIPSGPLFEKTASNLEEAHARGAPVIAITDPQGAPRLSRLAARLVILPGVDPFVAPILQAIPVQMLAYHVAVLKGTDIDQPRNLAKSVTVE